MKSLALTLTVLALTLSSLPAADYKPKPEHFRSVDGQLYNIMLSTNWYVLGTQGDQARNKRLGRQAIGLGVMQIGAYWDLHVVAVIDAEEAVVVEETRVVKRGLTRETVTGRQIKILNYPAKVVVGEVIHHPTVMDVAHKNGLLICDYGEPPKPKGVAVK